jgi:hypothetical protein
MGITRRTLGRGIVGAIVGTIAYPFGVKAKQEDSVKLPIVYVNWTKAHNPLWYQSRAYMDGKEVASWGKWGTDGTEQETVQEGVSFYEDVFHGHEILYLFAPNMIGGA